MACLTRRFVSAKKLIRDKCDNKCFDVSIYEIIHIFELRLYGYTHWERGQFEPMCGFIAQLVEHRTGIAEVTGSNPVEALIIFQASSFQLLKLENSLR